MVAITVAIPTIIANRYRAEVKPSKVTVPTSKSEANPHKIFERYVALAREASTSGDRVAAENLYQHAEHYFRVMNAANEGHQHRAMPPTVAADFDTERVEEDGSEMAGPVRTSLSNQQPYSA